MSNSHDYGLHGRKLLIGIAVLAVSSIGLMWGWNTFAVDLLSQQRMEFRHALALEFFLLAVAATVPLTWRVFSARDRS